MAESTVAVTEGTPGKRFHTWQRTISATAVEDEFVIPGEYPLASYIAQGATVSIATLNDHIFQLMAGAALNVRIRKITIKQAGLATAATLGSFDILRLTTAGTGGGAITPARLDNADSAAGAAGMTLPTVKGTESTVLWRDRFQMRQTNPVSPSLAESIVWQQQPGQKPIIIPAGTTNGIAVKNLTAVAGAQLDVMIEFVETTFV